MENRVIGGVPVHLCFETLKMCHISICSCATQHMPNRKIMSLNQTFFKHFRQTFFFKHFRQTFFKHLDSLCFASLCSPKCDNAIPHVQQCARLVLHALAITKASLGRVRVRSSAKKRTRSRFSAHTNLISYLLQGPRFVLHAPCVGRPTIANFKYLPR